MKSRWIVTGAAALVLTLGATQAVTVARGSNVAGKTMITTESDAFAREPEPGDDRGRGRGRGGEIEPGDDHGGRASSIVNGNAMVREPEVGDDRGRGGHQEPGDDRRGRHG